MSDTNEKGSGSCFWVVFLLLGLIILGAGGYFAFESFQLVQSGKTITAVVVDFHEQETDDQQIRYAPILEYSVDGKSYRFASASYANSPAYDIGEELPVLYDASDPNQARINRFSALWGIPIGFAIAAIFVLFVSFGGLIRTRKTM